MLTTRRGLLRGVAGMAALRAVARAADYTKNLGAELYTVRDTLKTDPEGTLKAVAAIGYREVECGAEDLPRLAPIFKTLNLAVSAAHYSTAEAIDENLWKTRTEQARADGLQWMGVPYLENQYRNPESFRQITEKLNRAGEISKSAGLRLFYHNHAFEFSPFEQKRYLDVLMERTDPALVALELDVFWASVAGADPVQVMKQYRDRVRLVHLKDKARNTPPKTNESVPKSAFKEVGNGVLDMPAILRESEAIGVAYRFVEQDWCPGDPLASLRQSYDYIRRQSS